MVEYILPDDLKEYHYCTACTCRSVPYIRLGDRKCLQFHSCALLVQTVASGQDTNGTKVHKVSISVGIINTMAAKNDRAFWIVKYQKPDTG